MASGTSRSWAPASSASRWRELAGRRPGESVVVLEREDRVGFHQTGHNSGAIHAGIYYAPGSPKAKLCVEDARDTYEFCERHETRMSATAS